MSNSAKSRRTLSPRGPAGLRLRLPTLEVFSALHGNALALRERKLFSTEQDIARSVFGNSIDLNVVKIVAWPGIRIKHILDLSRPHTLGNNIRVPFRLALSHRTLIHELAHVWQYQTKGTEYITNSIRHQVTGNAYAIPDPIPPGKSIHEFAAEQQATIIELYFSDSSKRNDPEYQRMIEEVRQTRPIPQRARQRLILQEAAFGSNTSRYEIPRSFQRNRGTHNIPLIRIEF